MAIRKSKKEKKRLFIISIAILSLLLILVSSVFNDWKQILQNRKLETELTLKYENLLENELKMNTELLKLQDDEYLARYAKEMFMLTSDGDIIIKHKKTS